MLVSYGILNITFLSCEVLHCSFSLSPSSFPSFLPDVSPPISLSCSSPHRSRPREFTPSLPTSPPHLPTSLPSIPHQTHLPLTSVECLSLFRPRPLASEPSPISPASTNVSLLCTAPRAHSKLAISVVLNWVLPSP